MWVQVALHFLVLPLFILVVSRRIFRAFLKMSKEDEVVCSQRFNRAIIAITFVYGGFTTIVQAYDANISIATTHDSAVYWIWGTIVFYVFDCILLAVYRQFNVSMWIHHLLAISLFYTSVAFDKGHVGCMIALLAEALVPWGFLLFFFRAMQWTFSLWFQLVCCGGMITLSCRMLQWCFVLYVHNMKSWMQLPWMFSWFVNFSLVGGLALDATWFQLYLSNFKRSISGAGLFGKRTKSMQQLREMAE